MSIVVFHQWAKPKDEPKITRMRCSPASVTSVGGRCGCASGYSSWSSPWHGTRWASCFWRLQSSHGAEGQQPCRIWRTSNGGIWVSLLQRRNPMDETPAECMLTTTLQARIMNLLLVAVLSRVRNGITIVPSSRKPSWRRLESALG